MLAKKEVGKYLKSELSDKLNQVPKDRFPNLYCKLAKTSPKLGLLIRARMSVYEKAICCKAGNTTTTIDQISIKTPNPKCRLYWYLIEFIDWRDSQSCWYFRPLLWNSAPLIFSLVHLPPPFPVWISTVVHVFIQCVTGGGGGDWGAPDR